MNNRELYYGYTPMNSFMGMPNDNNYTNSIFNDMKTRIERLERMVERDRTPKDILRRDEIQTC